MNHASSTLRLGRIVKVLPSRKNPSEIHGYISVFESPLDVLYEEAGLRGTYRPKVGEMVIFDHEPNGKGGLAKDVRRANDALDVPSALLLLRSPHTELVQRGIQFLVASTELSDEDLAKHVGGLKAHAIKGALHQLVHSSEDRERARFRAALDRLSQDPACRVREVARMARFELVLGEDDFHSLFKELKGLGAEHDWGDAGREYDPFGVEEALVFSEVARTLLHEAQRLGVWPSLWRDHLDSEIGCFAEAAERQFLQEVSNPADLRDYLEPNGVKRRLSYFGNEILGRRLAEPRFDNLLPWFAESDSEAVAYGAIRLLVQRQRVDEAVRLLKGRPNNPDDLFYWLPPRFWNEPEWKAAVPFEAVQQAMRALPPEGPYPPELLEVAAEALRRSRSRSMAEDAMARDETLTRELAGGLTPFERERFCESMPRGVLLHDKVLRVAVPRTVVKVLAQAGEPKLRWLDLTVSVRMVWIHRACWKGEGLPETHPARRDPAKVVQATIALYDLLRAPAAETAKKEEIVSAFDLELREHLMALASEEDSPPIDLRPLIPQCSFIRQRAPQSKRDYPGPLAPDVHHCEARRWPNLESGSQPKAWCPRCSLACSRATLDRDGRIRNHDGPIGARVFEMPGLSWFEASLTEVFGKIGVSPEPKGLDKGEHYVTALAGYANRLHDIRERLVCKHEQHGPLVPNFALARMPDACYNKTFFYCPTHPHDPVHDAQPGRYFNHCWCCRRVIDSGESPYHAIEIDYLDFKHGLYYCLHCGAGSLPDKHTRRCDLGTVCPKCGSRGEMVVEAETHYEARLRCTSRSCGTKGGHVIHVPMKALRYKRAIVSWSTEGEAGENRMENLGESDPSA